MDNMEYQEEVKQRLLQQFPTFAIEEIDYIFKKFMAAIKKYEWSIYKDYEKREIMFFEGLKIAFQSYENNFHTSDIRTDEFKGCYIIKFKNVTFDSSFENTEFADITGFLNSSYSSIVKRKIGSIAKDRFISCFHFPSMHILSFEELQAVMQKLEKESELNELRFKRNQIKTQLDEIDYKIESFKRNIEEHLNDNRND